MSRYLEDFDRAHARYSERIKAYYGMRYDLWRALIGTLTCDHPDIIGKRMGMLTSASEAGHPVLIVVPQRAHPRRSEQMLLRVLSATKAEVRRIIFTGGVGLIPDKNKRLVEGEPIGEYNAVQMASYYRREVVKDRALAPWDIYWDLAVHIDVRSKHTGHQAHVIREDICAIAPAIVAFVAPVEHCPRLMLTALAAVNRARYSTQSNGQSFLPPAYQRVVENVQFLAFPVMPEDGRGWNGATDARISAAQDAFGLPDESIYPYNVFGPNKRGRELVERMGEEMYGANAENFICSATPLEDAFSRQTLARELELMDEVLAS